MENVHKPELRPWISKRINVRSFLNEWARNFFTYNTFPKLQEIVSEEEYAAVEEKCSLAAMTCPNQHPVDLSSELILPERCDLETLKLQQEDLLKRKNDAAYDGVVYNNTKFYNYPLYLNYDVVNKDEECSFVPVEEPEVLLTVQIFRPEKRVTNPKVARFPLFHIDQEFMVLGSQHLTELRDKIDCVSDRAIPGEFSENPNQSIEYTCQDLYKSGFFYINGIFYSDMRDPDCKDYSEIIIKWSESKDRGIGPFNKKLMERAKFIDLEIQLGYPYLYVHQGNCEHFIVFSDLVMFSSHYNQNRNRYPLYVAVRPKKRVFCMICHIHKADWITFGNKRVPETPFYFCKSCFFSFNYDENNQKIGEFEAYHHIDRSVIV